MESHQISVHSPGYSLGSVRGDSCGYFLRSLSNTAEVSGPLLGILSIQPSDTAGVTIFGFPSPHPSAATVKFYFREEWEQYFKFSVVRNPWDRAVSEYYWNTRNLKMRPDFSEYVASAFGNSSNTRGKRRI